MLQGKLCGSTCGPFVLFVSIFVVACEKSWGLSTGNEVYAAGNLLGGTVWAIMLMEGGLLVIYTRSFYRGDKRGGPRG